MTGMMASLFADPTSRSLNRSAVLAACKKDPLASFPKEPPLQKTTIKSVSRAGHSFRVEIEREVVSKGKMVELRHPVNSMLQF